PHRGTVLAGAAGRAVELGARLGPAQASADPGADPRPRRDGAADPDHARQPAGRAAQALRRDGALEGAPRVARDREVPSSHGAQPVREHDRLYAAVHRLRQHHRLARARPADRRPAAAQGAHLAGHVPGRHDRAAPGRDDGHRDLDLGHPAGLDRSTHPARGHVMAIATDAGSLPSASAEDKQRIFVASQWQLMWWRFRKHRLAVASGVVIAGFYLVVLGADFLAYSDPLASEAQRSLMPPQPIRWFDDGRFHPHVYGFKGARDPLTFKRVYQADPSQKIPVRFFAQGFEYRFLGLIPMSRH